MADDELATSVSLANPSTGIHEMFVAGTPTGDLPDWARQRITNPDVWRGDGGASSASVPDSSELKRPPESGAGSGRESWAAYAAELGVEVTDDMGRDDIIAAVDAAIES
ncbi:MAG: hypothetical protein BRC31_04650 [Actinobacteria bacterium QS_5_72_10]|nr:MAG: hypothetical protein BRC31_04650 [Actinobacteria bacterium QS_5_72_10]